MPECWLKLWRVCLRQCFFRLRLDGYPIKNPSYNQDNFLPGYRLGGIRLVTTTDWFFTVSGIALLISGGFGASDVAGIPPFQPAWLVIPETLFLVSGLIWAIVLLPIQVRQARQARSFIDAAPIPAAYRRDSRLWLIWGIAATVPRVAAIYVMIAKPW